MLSAPALRARGVWGRMGAWLASRGYGLVPIMSAYLAGNFVSFVLAYLLSLLKN